MKCSCLPQYFVQNLDNDVHVLTFNSSVPREFLMPKGTNNRGFGTGLTGSKTLWGSHSHFDKLSTNHGCGRMFGVKGFRPHPPKAQTFHPAVCTMRAAKYSAAVETCDCSVLTIHQAPPCGHSWLVAVALRDDEGWKEESQLTSSNVPRTAVWVMRIELFVFSKNHLSSRGLWISCRCCQCLLSCFCLVFSRRPPRPPRPPCPSTLPHLSVSLTFLGPSSTHGTLVDDWMLHVR